jgi:hypothetical protein
VHLCRGTVSIGKAAGRRGSRETLALLGNHDKAIFTSGARMNPLAAAAIDRKRRGGGYVVTCNNVRR